jgi:CRP-like cAMP-binding protein
VCVCMCVCMCLSCCNLVFPIPTISVLSTHTHTHTQVADIVAQLNERDEIFRRKMDEINFFCVDRKLPKELTTRIRNHFINFWSRRGGIDDRAVFKELTPSLRKEVNVLLNQDIIQKCPLFRGCPDGFVHHVVSRLQSQIYCPGETIVKIGDVGYEMYFIGRGQVEITIASGNVVGTLTSGQFFGEIAMIEDKSIRSATISAKSFCDLFVLMKNDFLKVTKSYPEQLARMQFAAAQRRGKDNMIKVLTRCKHFAKVTDARERFIGDLVKSFELVDKQFVGGDLVFDSHDKADALYFIGDGFIEIREDAVVLSGPLNKGGAPNSVRANRRKASVFRARSDSVRADQKHSEPGQEERHPSLLKDGDASFNFNMMRTPPANKTDSKLESGKGDVYSTVFTAMKNRHARTTNGKLLGTLSKGACFGWIDTSKHAAGTQLLYNWVDDQSGDVDFIDFSHAFQNALQAEELRKKGETNAKGTFAINALVSEKKLLEYKAPPVVLFKLSMERYDGLMRKLYNSGPLEEFVELVTEFCDPEIYAHRHDYIAEDLEAEMQHDNRWLQQLARLKHETAKVNGMFGEMNPEELKYVGEYLRGIQSSIHQDLVDIVQDVDDAEAEAYTLEE